MRTIYLTQSFDKRVLEAFESHIHAEQSWKISYSNVKRVRIQFDQDPGNIRLTHVILVTDDSVGRSFNERHESIGTILAVALHSEPEHL